jgi:hypothetical protein
MAKRVLGSDLDDAKARTVTALCEAIGIGVSHLSGQRSWSAGSHPGACKASTE